MLKIQGLKVQRLEVRKWITPWSIGSGRGGLLTVETLLHGVKRLWNLAARPLDLARRILSGRKREIAASAAGKDRRQGTGDGRPGTVVFSGAMSAEENFAGNVSGSTRIKEGERQEATGENEGIRDPVIVLNLRSEWRPRSVCPRCGRAKTFGRWRESRCFLGTCVKPMNRFVRARLNLAH